jgi:predicted membrane protein
MGPLYVICQKGHLRDISFILTALILIGTHFVDGLA